MFLSIYNLPSNVQYSHIKQLLQLKCGFKEFVLDSLMSDGGNCKVTIGLADDEDAAILVTKINGIFFGGQKIFVKSLKKKQNAFGNHSCPQQSANQLTSQMMPQSFVTFEDLNILEGDICKDQSSNSTTSSSQSNCYPEANNNSACNQTLQDRDSKMSDKLGNSRKRFLNHDEPIPNKGQEDLRDFKRNFSSRDFELSASSSHCRHGTAPRKYRRNSALHECERDLSSRPYKRKYRRNSASSDCDQHTSSRHCRRDTPSPDCKRDSSSRQFRQDLSSLNFERNISSRHYGRDTSPRKYRRDSPSRDFALDSRTRDNAYEYEKRRSSSCNFKRKVSHDRRDEPLHDREGDASARNYVQDVPSRGQLSDALECDRGQHINVRSYSQNLQVRDQEQNPPYTSRNINLISQQDEFSQQQKTDSKRSLENQQLFKPSTKDPHYFSIPREAKKFEFSKTFINETVTNKDSQEVSKTLEKNNDLEIETIDIHKENNIEMKNTSSEPVKNTNIVDLSKDNKFLKINPIQMGKSDKNPTGTAATEENTTTVKANELDLKRERKRLKNMRKNLRRQARNNDLGGKILTEPVKENNNIEKLNNDGDKEKSTKINKTYEDPVGIAGNFSVTGEISKLTVYNSTLVGKTGENSTRTLAKKENTNVQVNELDLKRERKRLKNMRKNFRRQQARNNKDLGKIVTEPIKENNNNEKQNNVVDKENSSKINKAYEEPVGNAENISVTEVSKFNVYNSILINKSGEKTNAIPAESRNETSVLTNLSGPSNRFSKIQRKKLTNQTVSKTDMLISVTCSKTGYISKEVGEQIVMRIDEAILQLAANKEQHIGPITVCGKPIYEDGSIKMACTNQHSLDWVKGEVRKMPIPGYGDLTVVETEKYLKRVRCGFALPMIWNREEVLIGTLLLLSNPDVNPERWLLYSLQRQERVGKTFVVVGIPEDLIPAIMARGRRLSFLLGSVYVKFADTNGNFGNTPPMENLVDSPFVTPMATVSAPPILKPNKPTPRYTHKGPVSMNAEPGPSQAASVQKIGIQDVICHNDVEMLTGPNHTN